MMIVPELHAIPFAPVADENLEKLERLLKNNGKVLGASFRFPGSPRPMEPKIDFSVRVGDATQVVSVLYGPRTLRLVESHSIQVDNIPGSK